jgi:hypothetical protein
VFGDVADLLETDDVGVLFCDFGDEVLFSLRPWVILPCWIYFYLVGIPLFLYKNVV